MAPWRSAQLAALVVAATGLPGCAVSESTGSGGGEVGALPVADLLELEPNDDEAQELGPIELDFVLGGAMAACGSNGSFEGTDRDRFSFSLLEPALMELRLEVWRGDLDLRLSDPDGDVLFEGTQPGVEGEQVSFSIGAGSSYGVELRCWMGDQPSWRLVFSELSP